MANETDFLDLYRKLELDPGCNPVELTQAYRRYVALWHPDRFADMASESDDAPLQELIAQYGAAMEFQRRYGRLPGAVISPRRRMTHRDVPRAPPRSMTTAIGPRSSRPRWLVLLVIMVIGVLIWRIAPLSMLPSEAALPQSAVRDIADVSASPRDEVLSIGMSAAAVRALEGDPTLIHDDRWEYGPSWIVFENDHVADWHSSPLHSLHTPGRGPSDAPP